MSTPTSSTEPTTKPAPPAGGEPTQKPGGLPSKLPPAVPGHAAMVVQRRDLFWQNVLREILSSLASAAAMSAGRLSATPTGSATGGSPVAELFDGRLAVITRLGQRIPIADVVPLFACSVSSGSAKERHLAEDVQCTVYQIRTPQGEVHTIPVHEISSFHALSDALIKRLQEQAMQQVAAREAQQSRGGPGDQPFGFAAFASLNRSEPE